MSDDEDFVNPSLGGEDEGGHPSWMTGEGLEDEEGGQPSWMSGGGFGEEDGGTGGDNAPPSWMTGLDDGDEGGGDSTPSWIGGGDSDDDGTTGHAESGGAPASSVDLLSSLLAGADMEDAIRQEEPEPEPEPEKPKKKKNKRAGKKDPKAMMKALKEQQNAADASGGKQTEAAAEVKVAALGPGAPKLRPAAAALRTVIVDSGRSRWRIGMEGEVAPAFISEESDADDADLEDRWISLEEFMAEHCGGVEALCSPWSNM